MYVTLSESKRELEGVAKSHGWSLDKVSIFELSSRAESLRLEDQYSAFHPAEIEFHDTTQSILDQVERAQPSRIVFDSLSDLRLLARDSFRYRRQIQALKHYFTNRNCTVILLDDNTAQPRDMQLYSIAHGVILLERIPREFGKVRRRLEVVKLRGSKFAEGYHDYSIETGGLAVWCRLVAADYGFVPNSGYLTTSNAGLDAMWGDGLERGTSTIFIGPAGSGKSSLAMSYAVSAAANGESVSVFLFDESLHTSHRRSIGLGSNPHPHLQSGNLRMRRIDPAEMSVGAFVELIRNAVESEKASVIVIDSLNGFIQAMPGEQHLALQMHELLSFLNQRGVATILVMTQSGLLSSKMRSPVDLSYLADNVLLLRFFEGGGQIRKALSVVKKRSGSHEKTIRELQLHDGRIQVGEPLTGFQGILSETAVNTGRHDSLEEGANGNDLTS